MRTDTGPRDHPAVPAPPGPALLRLVAGAPPVHDQPSLAVELCDQARSSLGRVVQLERGIPLGRRLELAEIDEITGTLHRLQATVATFTRDDARSSDLIVLRQARRHIGDALLLTLDLLDRSRTA